MFNLRHEEFADSKKTSARGDFITEGFPNGSTCERHPSIIKFEEFIEIEELALCRFGTEETFFIPRGTDGGVEHQVEFDWWFKDSASLWIMDTLFDDNITEFLARVIVDLS
jgi:hypothetical protein